MGMLVVSAVFVVILSALAYRANIRFRNERRLPMQWGMTGAVNWSAPRFVALAFIPILAIGVLGFQVFMALNVPCLLYTSPSPRDRQKSRMPSSA